MEEKKVEKSENLKIVEALSEKERIVILTSIMDYCENRKQYKGRIISVDDVFEKGATCGVNSAKAAISDFIKDGLKHLVLWQR